MTLTRDQVPRRVADLIGGRAVRWVPTDRAVGDYDGRERTLEVFDVEAREQRSLLRRVSPIRREIERAIGGTLVIVFHTPGETARLYPEMSFHRPYPALAVFIAQWMQRDHGAQPALEPDQLQRLALQEAKAA